MNWREATRIAGVTLFTAAGVAVLAGPAGAQRDGIERYLANIKVNSLSKTVLAKFGNPRDIAIGDRPAPGVSLGGGGQAGGMGAPGGMMGGGMMGADGEGGKMGGGMMGAPGAPSGMMGGPGGRGMMGGGMSSSSMGSSSMGGGMMGGPGGRGMMGGGMSSSSMGSSSMGGGMMGAPGAPSGMGAGKMGGMGGGMMGAPSGMSGGSMGGPNMGGMDGGMGGPSIGGFGQTTSNAAFQQETTWTYYKKIRDPKGQLQLISYDFLISPSGKVSQIRVVGNISSKDVRTAQGLVLGSSYREMIGRYGTPTKLTMDGNGTLICGYPKRHIEFQLKKSNAQDPLNNVYRIFVIQINSVE